MAALKKIIGLLLASAAMIAISTSYTWGQTAASERGIIYGGLSWSPDGSMLGVGSLTGVWIYNTTSLEEITHRLTSQAISALDWHPTQALIASASYKTIELWNVETGLVREISYPDPNRVPVMKWNPDGSLLAIANSNQQVIIWSLKEQIVISSIDLPEAKGGDILDIYDLDWSPDGRYLVLSGYFPTCIWDVQENVLMDNTIRLRRIDPLLASPASGGGWWGLALH